MPATMTHTGAALASRHLQSQAQSLAMNPHCEVWFDLIGAQC
jgi:hypothetical protein